jgi:hypothetical protein
MVPINEVRKRLSRVSQLARYRESHRGHSMLAFTAAAVIALANAAPVHSQTHEEQMDEAFGQLMTDQELLAQFACEFSDNRMLGILAANGEGETTTAVISVTVESTALINGTAVDDYHTLQVTEQDQSLGGIIYEVMPVYKALFGGGSDGGTASGYGLTAEEQADLQLFMGLAEAMTENLMGDRKRYMLISLREKSIRFFDLAPDGMVVNHAAAECVAIF